MELGKYKESKWWDCNITLDELIQNNDRCILFVNYHRHKSDDSFGRFVLLIKYPNTDCEFITIGVCEDGFVCNGLGYPSECIKSSKVLPIRVGMDFLDKWGKCVNALSDFNSVLIPHVDEDCINLTFENNFESENKNSRKDLTIRNADEYIKSKELLLNESKEILKVYITKTVNEIIQKEIGGRDDVFKLLELDVTHNTPDIDSNYVISITYKIFDKSLYNKTLLYSQEDVDKYIDKIDFYKMVTEQLTTIIKQKILTSRWNHEI